MAPAPITEDFYMILELDKSATIELITQSYKRLARKLHPDRNHDRNATAAFQLLGKAYETLKDETKRRDYDLIYPSLRQTRAPPQSTQTHRASGPQPGGSNEEAQIAAIQKSKEDRRTQWWTKKFSLESSIFEMRREIRRLEQDIKTLADIAAGLAEEEARSKTWRAWILSPLYKQVQLSEGQKELKERQNQERRIQIDMKERRLEAKKKESEKQEKLLNIGQAEIDCADRVDDFRIQRLQAVVDARLAREREAAEKIRQEEISRRRKQEQERREREEAERRRQWLEKEMENARRRYNEQQEAEKKRAAEAEKRRKEYQEAEQKRKEEQATRARAEGFMFDYDLGTTSSAAAAACLHYGWWAKVQGRTACPECCEVWTYLLKCPDCSKKACPKCQAAIRARRRNRQPQPPPRRVPEYDAFDYWD